jgi:hypothetical protein
MLLVDRIEVVHPGSRSPHQIEGPVARKVNNRPIVSVADRTLPEGTTSSDYVREAVEADRQKRASEGRL